MMSDPADLFGVQTQPNGSFKLFGELSFASASQALKLTAKLFSGPATVVFDLLEVGRVDSAGVALLLEWRRVANEQGVALDFINPPDQLRAIAHVSGVDGILGLV